jgi:DNA-binding response OmpR family regulator
MKMPTVLTSASIRLDPKYFTCTVKKRQVTLTADQFRLLYCLMEEPGRVFTREEIILATKGADYPVTLKSVDVAIHHLRKIIGEGMIEAVRGMGYRFEDG